MTPSGQWGSCATLLTPLLWWLRTTINWCTSDITTRIIWGHRQRQYCVTMFAWSLSQRRYSPPCHADIAFVILLSGEGWLLLRIKGVGYSSESGVRSMKLVSVCVQIGHFSARKQIIVRNLINARFKVLLHGHLTIHSCASINNDWSRR